MSTAFGARGRMSAGAGRPVLQSVHLLYRVLCTCRSPPGRRHRRATDGLSARLWNGMDRDTYVVRWFTCVLRCAVPVAGAVEHCE
jgi:hypothetical protein